MPVTNYTVAEVLDDAYRKWRGAVITEAGPDERAAMRRSAEHHARNAWRKYHWYFGSKIDSAAVTDSVVTIPADCESIMRVIDPSSGISLKYTQVGTTEITLEATGYDSVNLEYRTNQPTYGDTETEEVPAEMYEYLVDAVQADCWAIDRQMSKHKYWLQFAFEQLRLSMDVIERQRGLKIRPTVRNYRLNR